MGRHLMPSLKLKFVERFRDRRGVVRHYFRRGHGHRSPLPGQPGSVEFLEAYQAALDRKEIAAVGQDIFERGSVAWAAQQYFLSPNFLRLKKSTQAVNRGIIERFAAEHGHRILKQLKREHILKILGKRAETPAAANNLLKKIRVLIGFAIDDLKIDMADPTVRIKRFKEGEHHTWTDDEVAQFEKAHSLGTFERVAFDLHLYTGQRREDVRIMAWSDIRSEVINVCQEKGGAKLEIPLHRNLAKSLQAWKKHHLVILPSRKGKAYTVESYGNLMADAIAAASLPERCVLHGIRKAAARRLAEAGCTTHMIAAITGHKSLKEVERYTRAVEQRRLARAAIRRLPQST